MELLSIINFIGLLYLLVVVHELKSSTRTGKKTQPISSKNTYDEVPVYQEVKPRSTSEEPDVLQRFFVWFARDWPLKIGALFILLGFVWLVTYAFLNNWIGEVGRIVFGMVVGSIIMVWGSSRIKQNIYQGEILTALGGGIILISIYSAQYVYDKMFPPYVALALVSLVTVTVSYISYHNNTIRLAILGFLIGAVAPMLMGSDSSGVLGLFSYLFCLTIATVWLVRVTGWRALTLLALFVIWIYSIPWLGLSTSPVNLVYMRFFAVTFSIMFYLLSLSGFAFDKTVKSEDALVGSLIGLYSLHWILTIIPPDYRSILCVVFAVGFMMGAFIIFRLHKVEYPVYLYTGVSIIFLIAATLIQFHGNVLPVVLATEAITLVIFADTVYSSRMVKLMAFLFILPLMYSIPLLLDFLSTHESSTLIYINLITYATGIYLAKYTKQTDSELTKLGRILIVAAGIFSLVYLWVSMPYYVGYQNELYSTTPPTNLYNPKTDIYDPLYSSVGSSLFVAHAITLTLYSLVGIGLYLFGMREKRSLTKRFGFWLTCFVIARLLLVEVWDMTLAARIVTFFIIGVIFIASVFVRRSNHEIH